MLLNLIAGIEEVTAGTIEIGGRDVTHLDPRKRDIAMVFQNYALYPHMTVRGNLGFGLKLRKAGKPEIAARVDEVARILGLEEMLDRKPVELSGGQRQRVAMGRAIVREPQAFLMDEPLSNLDAKLRVSMRAQLSRLHERLGVTTVYVTHDQVEAMTLGERVAVMRGGVVQQCDTPERLFDHPANLFVAAFIGSPAMNLVSAEVVGNEVRFGACRVPLAPGSPLSGRIVLGIRPHDLRLGAAARSPAACRWSSASAPRPTSWSASTRRACARRRRRRRARRRRPARRGRPRGVHRRHPRACGDRRRRRGRARGRRRAPARLRRRERRGAGR
jgi:multiple sugar transport system ATP-binding protein